MDPVNVTVISCLYGNTHDRFLSDWIGAVGRLDPPPQEIILSTDRAHFIPQVNAIQHRMNGGWRYPQAFHLTKALDYVQTEWVWIHDIDDLAFPDALEGIEHSDADIVQCGYERSDGEVYIPPVLPSDEILALKHNPFVAGSFVRTDAVTDAGGFPDVALQDWALWRRLAWGGAVFATTDRPRFRYMRHAQTRGETELTIEERGRHMAEMWDWEESPALAS